MAEEENQVPERFRPVKTLDVTKMVGSKPLPAELQGLFTLRDWAESLVNGVRYVEPDPDYLARTLMMQTITASTPEEVMAQGKIKKLQEAIADVPGAGTGPIEITEIYVTSTDFHEGAPCYIIFNGISLINGNEERYTTGATMIQAQFLRLISLGQWPLRGQIKRTERKDKGGHYLFWFFPPD